MKIKFREVPIGGRINYCGKIWVVIENFGDGIVHQYTGEINKWQSICCFVDEEEGTTLDTEVDFIN